MFKSPSPWPSYLLCSLWLCLNYIIAMLLLVSWMSTHNHRFEVFFVKKKYLLVGTSGLYYERVNGWVSEWVGGWVRDVRISHQSDWIYYKQSIKFLVFVTGTCNMMLLLVWNGNLTLLFFSYQWLQLKVTNQWFLFTRSE